MPEISHSTTAPMKHCYSRSAQQAVLRTRAGRVFARRRRVFGKPAIVLRGFPAGLSLWRGELARGGIFRRPVGGSLRLGGDSQQKDDEQSGECAGNRGEEF